MGQHDRGDHPVGPRAGNHGVDVGDGWSNRDDLERDGQGRRRIGCGEGLGDRGDHGRLVDVPAPLGGRVDEGVLSGGLDRRDRSAIDLGRHGGDAGFENCLVDGHPGSDAQPIHGRARLLDDAFQRVARPPDGERVVEHRLHVRAPSELGVGQGGVAGFRLERDRAGAHGRECRFELGRGLVPGEPGHLDSADRHAGGDLSGVALLIGQDRPDGDDRHEQDADDERDEHAVGPPPIRLDDGAVDLGLSRGVMMRGSSYQQVSPLRGVRFSTALGMERRRVGRHIVCQARGRTTIRRFGSSPIDWVTTSGLSRRAMWIQRRSRAGIGSSWSILPVSTTRSAARWAISTELALAPAAVVLDVDEDAGPVAHLGATASG